MKKDHFRKSFAKLMERNLTEDKEISTNSNLSENFKNIAPDIEKYITEFVYGDVYSRPGLGDKQRALITISSLVTQGTEPQLELHLNKGITIGLTSTEIVEGIIHLIPYTDFSRVLNALTVAKKVFAQRQLQL
ncbi:TPA: carboxymuconolactone decarboxylase family protein [Bacillus cereus]